MCPDGLITPQRDTWANGIPLADADYSFAPQELRVEYEEFFNPPSKPSGKDRPAAPAEIMSDSSGDPVVAIAKNVQLLVEILAIPSEMRWDMRNRLLRSLGEGKFVVMPQGKAADEAKQPATSATLALVQHLLDVAPGSDPSGHCQKKQEADTMSLDKFIL